MDIQEGSEEILRPRYQSTGKKTVIKHTYGFHQHIPYRWGVPGMRRNKIEQEWVCFVKECTFTFQFRPLDQRDEMINYFSVKTHPSTRKTHNGLEHYWQSWRERLPTGLVKEPKRLKILKALRKAKNDC